MTRAITYLLLILFVGSQADDVVRLCAEMLCPEGHTHGCCHQSRSEKNRLTVKMEAGHCAPAETASPLQLDRATCCESPADAARNFFRTAERLPKDTVRQLLLSASRPSGLPNFPPDSSPSVILPPAFLQDPSPPDLLSTVLRI